MPAYNWQRTCMPARRGSSDFAALRTTKAGALGEMSLFVCVCVCVCLFGSSARLHLSAAIFGYGSK